MFRMCSMHILHNIISLHKCKFVVHSLTVPDKNTRCFIEKSNLSNLKRKSVLILDSGHWSSNKVKLLCGIRSFLAVKHV